MTTTTHRRRVAACGTPAGYKRHARAGEPACPECRYAKRLQSRRQTQKRKTGITCDAPEPCSPAGYAWHVSHGGRPCPACIRYTDGVPVFDVDKARRDLDRYLRARRARKGRAARD